MKENIYVSNKAASSSSRNVIIILGAIIILLLFVNAGQFFSKNSTSPSDNSLLNNVISTITENATSIPIITETAIPTATLTISITPSITPTGTPVKIYFYKSPIKPNQDTNEIFAVDRYTTETNLLPFAIKEFFKGPTSNETTAGYILPYTLTGDSNCSGSNYKFSYSLPTLKLTICKQIEPTPESGDGGGYAGSSLKAMSRVLKVITTSLKVSGITKVEVYDKNGSCYGPETGLNGCTP